MMKFKKCCVGLLVALSSMTGYAPALIQSATAAGMSYVDTVNADSPRAFWRLDEASGTAMMDVKGNHSGTYAGSPTLEQSGAIVGDSNTSVAFNGSSSYGTVSYSGNLNSATFTIEAWAYPTGGSDYRTVVGNRDYPNGWIIYAQSTSAGNNWSFWINNGSGMTALNGPVIKLNAWTHLVGTYDGAIARFYVNGTLAASQAIADYAPNAINALTIGKGQPGQNFYFPGRVDEVSYYQTALDATRVNAHYLAGTAGTPPPPPPPKKCADGIDNDSDTKIDLTDPGCSSATDDDETDVPPPPPPGVVTWGKAVVSLTFDDGYTSHRTIAAPELASFGFKGTAYTNTQPANDAYENYMTWPQIQELQNDYGWEVANHTYSHLDLTTLSKAGIRTELTRGIDDLKAHGITPVSFATPFGAFNNIVVNEIARLHSSHRTVWNINNAWPNAPYDLRSKQAVASDSVATVSSWIDEAISTNTWLILTFHDIKATGAIDYDYPASRFHDVLAYLKSTGVPVATVKEVMDAWGVGSNLVPNGSFELGSGSNAQSWTRTHLTKVSVQSNDVGVYPAPLRSVKIDTRFRVNAPVGIQSDLFTIDASKKYRLKAFVRITGYSSGSAVAQVKEYNSNGVLLSTQNIGSLSGNSIDSRYFDYTPHVLAARVALFIHHSANGRLMTEVDGVEMKERS